MAAGPNWAGTAIERPAVVAIYLGFAHLALAGLGLWIALRPDALAVSTAHPLAVAMTHALTLGWITASILGSLYVVLPLALGAHLTVHRSDVALAGGFVVGALGVVATTALGRGDLVAWPGTLVTAVPAVVGNRALGALLRSRAPRAITAHVALAFVAVVLAATLALAWGTGWLRVPRADFVAAHAHLAALGFAVTMAVGIGHRLLPMFLPAAPRSTRLQWATLLVPLGALAFAATTLLAPDLVLPAAALVGAGLAVFFLGVVRLLRDGRPPPRDLVRPDPGKVQIFCAVASLLAATVVGLSLVGADPAPPRAAFAYGVLGLLGFLGQLIAGIGLRLFPTFLWAHAWRGRAPQAPPPASPVRMPSRPLAWGGLVGLAGAIVLLGLSAGTPHVAGIRAGGVTLLLAATALAVNLVHSARRAGAV